LQPQQCIFGSIFSVLADWRQNVFFAIFQILFSHVPSTIFHLLQWGQAFIFPQFLVFNLSSIDFSTEKLFHPSMATGQILEVGKLIFLTKILFSI
jgi:hypothetical protein